MHDCFLETTTNGEMTYESFPSALSMPNCFHIKEDIATGINNKAESRLVTKTSIWYRHNAPIFNQNTSKPMISGILLLLLCIVLRIVVKPMSPLNNKKRKTLQQFDSNMCCFMLPVAFKSVMCLLHCYCSLKAHSAVPNYPEEYLIHSFRLTLLIRSYMQNHCDDPRLSCQGDLLESRSQHCLGCCADAKCRSSVCGPQRVQSISPYPDDVRSVSMLD